MPRKLQKKWRSLERMLYGVIIAFLGGLWFFSSIGTIRTDFQFGPAIIVVIGLAFILLELRKD